MSKLNKKLATGVLVLAMTGGIGLAEATIATSSASASTATIQATTGTVAGMAPVFDRHRRWRWGRCVWFTRGGKVRFGRGGRHVRITWSNGHWRIRRSFGCHRRFHHRWWW